MGSVNKAPKRVRRAAASPVIASPNQLTAQSTRSETMRPGSTAIEQPPSNVASAASPCPPPVAEPVTRDDSLPGLLALPLVHRSVAGVQDWRWFDGTPLAGQLERERVLVARPARRQAR